MNAMLPVNLTESVNKLSSAAQTMTEEIRRDREQRAAENRRMIALLVVVLVLVAGLATLSISNRRLGNANSDLNRQNAKIVERIESCTTVGGECYEESNRRTGDIVGNIIRQGMYTQLCLRDHPNAGDTQIEACVLDRVQKAAAERSEPPPSGLGPSGEPIPGTSSPPEPSPTP